MIDALPSWVDREAWDGFVEMRKMEKAPLTPRAIKLILKELYSMRSEGHCPNYALDQSTINNWKSVYPPKKSLTSPAQNSKSVQETRLYLDQLSAQAKQARPPPEHLRRKRVAPWDTEEPLA